MKIKALLVLLGIVPLCAYGQYSYYKYAQITKTDSSTLSGYVERVSEGDVSRTIHFKKSIEDTQKTIIPIAEIDHVIFNDDASLFCRVPYVPFQDSTKKAEYRLAKKLLGGYADLYKLQLPIEELHIVYAKTNTFVYIVKIDTVFYVLSQTEILDTSRSDGVFEGYAYKLHKKYVSVLEHILQPDDLHKRRLKKLKFTDNEIIPLIDDLNETHPEIARKTFFKKEKIAVNHAMSAGFVTPFGPNTSPFFGFEIGYLVKLCQPSLSEKFVSEIGISYVSMSDPHDNGSTIKSFKIPIGVTYHFTNNPIGPYTYLGFSWYGGFSLMKMGLGVTVSKNLAMAVTTESFNWLFWRGGILGFNCSYNFAGNGVR